VAVVEKLAKGGDVVAGGGLGQRSFVMSAGTGGEQRGAEPKQERETVRDDPRQESYTKNFAV